MEITDKDLREHERIIGELIPEELKHFSVDLCIGEILEARTTDFTSKGIRLFIPLPYTEFQQGQIIIILPKTKKYKLIGEIRHSLMIDNKTCYTGILFLKTKSLKKYIEEIKKKQY